MQDGHAARTSSMDMQHGQQHGHAAWTCSIDMQHGHAARTCGKNMQHGHAAWTCSMDMQQGGHAAWTSSIHMQHGHLAWTCSMDLFMYVHTCPRTRVHVQKFTLFSHIHKVKFLLASFRWSFGRKFRRNERNMALVKRNRKFYFGETIAVDTQIVHTPYCAEQVIVLSGRNLKKQQCNIKLFFYWPKPIRMLTKNFKTILKRKASCRFHTKLPTEKNKNSYRTACRGHFLVSGDWSDRPPRTGFGVSFYDDDMSPFPWDYLHILEVH
jgi:hypothetical protein